MTMRKNTLLLAVAAAALAVGSGTALAQGAPQAGQKADSPAVQSNPASKNAPAEKIQGQEHRGAKPETTGQGASERGQKMGQDNKEQNKLNKSTTGQAPTEPKSGQANERRDNKMGQDQKSPKSTTGQAPSQQTTPKSDRANEQTTPKSDRANEQNRPSSGQMNERGGTTQNQNRSGANENRTGTSTSTNTSVNVNLSSEQRSKIHSIIVSDRSAPRIAHADFDVRVGTVVPRGKVKFVPLPSTIVEIEPSWRGFEYFLVGDEIVVVDPATLRIVAVLPA
jgi:Protein of unknown function (DUF1236)